MTLLQHSRKEKPSKWANGEIRKELDEGASGSYLNLLFYQVLTLVHVQHVGLGLLLQTAVQQLDFLSFDGVTQSAAFTGPHWCCLRRRKKFPRPGCLELPAGGRESPDHGDKLYVPGWTPFCGGIPLAIATQPSCISGLGWGVLRLRRRDSIAPGSSCQQGPDKPSPFFPSLLCQA